MTMEYDVGFDIDEEFADEAGLFDDDSIFAYEDEDEMDFDEGDEILIDEL